MKTVKKVAMVPVYIVGALAGFCIWGLIGGLGYWVIQWFCYHIEYFIVPGFVVGLLVWAARKAKV